MRQVSETMALYYKVDGGNLQRLKPLPEPPLSEASTTERLRNALQVLHTASPDDLRRIGLLEHTEGRSFMLPILEAAHLSQDASMIDLETLQ
jgi:hypothetical protein